MNRIETLIIEGQLEEGTDYYIAVFDFGGGTTDLCLVKVCLEGTGLESIVKCHHLKSDGIHKGGEYLTFMLSKLLFDKIVASPELIKEASPTEKTVDEVASALQAIRYPHKDAREINAPDASYQEWERDNFRKLLNSAETLKLNYAKVAAESGEYRHDVYGFNCGVGDDPDLSDVSFKLPVVREELDQILMPHIEAGFELLDAMSEMAGLKPRGEGLGYWDELLLCGNSSRLPLVQQMAHDAYKDRVHFDSQKTKIGVVSGALTADAWIRQGTLEIIWNGSASGTDKTLPHPLGILRMGQLRVLFPAGASWDNTAPQGKPLPMKITSMSKTQHLRWQTSTQTPATKLPKAGKLDFSQFVNQTVYLRFMLREGQVACSVETNDGLQSLVTWTPYKEEE